MNNIINKFLLAGDKLLPEINLTKPKVCGPFTNIKAKMKKSKGTGDFRYIYRNKIGKAYFQHDMKYRDFKDLPRRTTPNNPTYE